MKFNELERRSLEGAFCATRQPREKPEGIIQRKIFVFYVAGLCCIKYIFCDVFRKNILGFFLGCRVAQNAPRNDGKTASTVESAIKNVAIPRS